jgi:hypothetical protein
VIHVVATLAPHQRVVLALTEDAPLPLPSAVAAMRRLLADRVAAVVVLPWQPRWRHERPSVATAHRRWTARAVDLAGLVADLSVTPEVAPQQQGALA